jgi:putative effector of murein hydrolase LrgA (UPF0299 family)
MLAWRRTDYAKIIAPSIIESAKSLVSIMRLAFMPAAVRIADAWIPVFRNFKIVSKLVPGSN